MMKYLLLSGLLTGAQLFLAQSKDLYFVKENDSITTVRDSNNKIIIPAYVDGNYRSASKEKIEEELVIINEQFGKFKIYNREGKFLFVPSLFDFGVEFREGYIPFIENGKYGLANKQGVKVIPAQYDYLEHPENGVVLACKLCRFDRSTDPEHPPLVDGTWFWLTNKGVVLGSKMYEQRGMPSEIFSTSVMDYNGEYQKVLSYFNQRKEAIKRKLKIKDEFVKFQVAYPPTSYFPYYHVKLYYQIGEKFATSFDGDEYVNYYVSKDLKHFLVFFEEWQELNDGKENYVDVKKRYVDVDTWLK